METKIFHGESGKKYKFWKYPIDFDFPENVDGNYIFVKEYPISKVCWPVYVGEGSIKDRINFRIQENNGEIFRKGCNYVYAHKNDNEKSRKAEEEDILEGDGKIAYAPMGCNIKKGG